MRDIAFQYKSDRYPFLDLHLLLKQFYEQFKKYGTPCDTYLKSFTNLQGVVSHCGGSLKEHAS